MALPTNNSRPAIPYVPTQVLPNYDRYESLGQFPPTAQQLDGDLNKMIDLINTLSDEINHVVVGALPGADDPLNANKLMTTDGAGNISWVKAASANLDDGAVTTVKIHNSAITPEKIQPQAIDTDQLATNAVRTIKILDENITTGKLANSSVTTPKINDGAVTNPKISDGAVTTHKISDEAVTTHKICQYAITSTQLQYPFLLPVCMAQFRIDGIYDYKFNTGNAVNMSTGIYNITFTSPAPSANLIVLMQNITSSVFGFISHQSTTGFRISFYNTLGDLMNTPFGIVVYAL